MRKTCGTLTRIAVSAILYSAGLIEKMRCRTPVPVIGDFVGRVIILLLSCHPRAKQRVPHGKEKSSSGTLRTGRLFFLVHIFSQAFIIATATFGTLTGPCLDGRLLHGLQSADNAHVRPGQTTRRN
jgi:hypothetical protein